MIHRENGYVWEPPFGSDLLNVVYPNTEHTEAYNWMIEKPFEWMTLQPHEQVLISPFMLEANIWGVPIEAIIMRGKTDEEVTSIFSVYELTLKNLLKEPSFPKNVVDVSIGNSRSSLHLAPFQMMCIRNFDTTEFGTGIKTHDLFFIKYPNISDNDYFESRNRLFSQSQPIFEQLQINAPSLPVK